MNLLKTALIGIFLSMLLSESCLAQEDVSLIKKTAFIHKSQINLMIGTMAFQGVKVTHQGDKPLKSYVSPNYEIGLEYSRLIHNNVSISLGCHWGKIPEQFTLRANVPELTAFYGENFRQSFYSLDFQYLQFPIYVSKTLLIKPNLIFNYSLGVDFNYIHLFEAGIISEYSTDTSYNPSSFKRLLTLSYVSEKDFFVGINAKIGINRVYKNSAIGVNLKVHYTPEYIAKGKYKIENTLQPSSGDLFVRFNYVGLEFVYGVRLSKKELKK